MLKYIIIDTKPDGTPITIPAGINEANFEQQVKRFIEIADYNPFDGQLPGNHGILRRFCVSRMQQGVLNVK
jgi:hypothetical protein